MVFRKSKSISILLSAYKLPDCIREGSFVIIMSSSTVTNQPLTLTSAKQQKGTDQAHSPILEISFSNGHTSKYHLFWLRDNCRCSKCFVDICHQSCYFGVYEENPDDAFVPTKVETGVSENGVGTLTIAWKSGHTSTYDADYLLRHCYSCKDKSKCPSHSMIIHPPKRILWEAKEFTKPMDQLFVKYKDFFNSDQVMLNCIENLIKYGMFIVTDTPHPKNGLTEELSKVGNRWAKVINNTCWGSFFGVNEGFIRSDRMKSIFSNYINKQILNQQIWPTRAENSSCTQIVYFGRKTQGFKCYIVRDFNTYFSFL